MQPVQLNLGSFLLRKKFPGYEVFSMFGVFAHLTASAELYHSAQFILHRYCMTTSPEICYPCSLSFRSHLRIFVASDQLDQLRQLAVIDTQDIECAEVSSPNHLLGFRVNCANNDYIFKEMNYVKLDRHSRTMTGSNRDS